MELPPAGDYATGIIMMDPDIVSKAEEVFGKIAAECNLQVILKTSGK